MHFVDREQFSDREGFVKDFGDLKSGRQVTSITSHPTMLHVPLCHTLKSGSHITSITSRHITSHHNTSHYITSHHIPLLSYHIQLCHNTPSDLCHITPSDLCNIFLSRTLKSGSHVTLSSHNKHNKPYFFKSNPASC